MEIYDFLKDAVLSLTDFDEDDLSLDSTLEDIALDSLDYVEIQVGLKKNFSVELDGDHLASGKIRSLRDLCDYIEQVRNGADIAVA
ncbi:acyl carrier protein [Zoogloeaceae bacterium G21618-S1]|nr:acyl carrier protein [Zoogloeaceae bacterium G21618-S1]